MQQPLISTESSRGTYFRRTRRVAVAVGAVVAVTLVAGIGRGGAAPAQTTPNIGTANAVAQALKVNPRAGSLSLGIAFGVSLADYQNTVARAESRAVDLGIIGSLLAAPGCDGGDPTLPAEDQPQPTRAEARGGSESSGEVPEDKAGGTMTKFAEATPDPYSRAVTTIAAREIIPGLLAIGAGQTETITRFADGVRESIAITDISSLTLAGGAVQLSGLHWEAIHRSGAVNESTGTFTFAHGSVQTLLGPLLGAAQALPLDPTVALTAIGEAIRPFGLSLVMPQSYEAGGFRFVDPLKIGFVPSEVRDGIVGAVLEGLRPVREPLVDALFEADCSSQSLVTVADVALGAFSGAGDFHLELGGVQATTRDLAATCFLCATGGLLGDLPTGPVTLPAVGSVGTFTPPAPATAAPAVAGPTAAPAAPAGPAGEPDESISALGKRGGPLALVSLLGLGLLAAVAEGDRRKMRKAQRLIRLEGA